MNKRIWELDVLRGVMIWGVVLVHLLFDLDYFLGIDVVKHPVLQYCLDRCGFLFVVLSGVSVTLGKHNVRRGLQVFGCGMAITAVTAAIYFLGFANKFIIIYFGVLHLLGVCMLLWSFFKKLPPWAMALFGAGCVALGVFLRGVRAESFWLVPFGVTFPGFSSSDYFPLFPHLGWFLLGASVGPWLLGAMRLPPRCQKYALSRFFGFCGRHSLLIYLIHQPVLYGIIKIASL